MPTPCYYVQGFTGREYGEWVDSGHAQRDWYHQGGEGPYEERRVVGGRAERLRPDLRAAVRGRAGPGERPLGGQLVVQRGAAGAIDPLASDGEVSFPIYEIGSTVTEVD